MHHPFRAFSFETMTMKQIARRPSARPSRPAARTLSPLTALTALIALGALGAATLTGCATEPGSRTASGETPRHVFLITVDTLRADHLSQYGYHRDTSPSLQRLADPGVVFEDAVSQWPKTGPSFASIFTGQYPQSTGLTHNAALDLPAAYLTLPELMKQQGYTTLGVVSNGVLAQTMGWNQGFDSYLETWKLAPEPSDDPVEYRKYLNARRVNQLALPLLERHKDDAKLFVWLHYSDPHGPYLLPADVENPFLGDRYDTRDQKAPVDRSRAVALGDHDELSYYVASYDGNVHFADQNIGAVLDRAQELGLLDDALVVFTADHGESLGEHDYYFGHGRLPYQPGAHVPLIVSWPGHLDGGRRVSGPVELVDLYPTLRDLAAPGIDIPGLEGHSLVPLLEDEGSQPGQPGQPGKASTEMAESTKAGARGDNPFRYAFAEAGGGSPTTHFRWVRDDRWKLIYHPPLGQRPRTWELYDLETDPGETKNLVEGDTHPYQRLRSVLAGWMKGSEWIRKPQSEVQVRSDETEKALKALGYIN